MGATNTKRMHPEAIRALGRMWALHTAGKSWSQVGQTMGVPSAYQTFQHVMQQAGDGEDWERVWPIAEAWESHAAHCRECVEGFERGAGPNTYRQR
jgi:hypothetical protein